ncbi:MAG: sugar phosphate isomerase/epimerase family protein [Chloroflexota bacterium]|nr:sugar phosphate isomerase/epimerase family protein [Chloroflexota bacterium]
MADRVYLSANMTNVAACVGLAVAYDLGVELMAFSNPTVLDGDWRTLVEDYAPLLRPLRGRLSMHGPFLDMSPGSPDARVNALVIERYKHAIDIAAQLGASPIVFHANFIAAIRSQDYRQGWHDRSLHFWYEIATYAESAGVMIAIENMWEFDPRIICDLLGDINHPNLRACLDVGHAHLFSDVPFETWLAVIEPYLIHAHVNNNNGVIDVHHALNDGVIDYLRVLPMLRALNRPPAFTLEMDTVNDMRISLPFFQFTAELAGD